MYRWGEFALEGFGHDEAGPRLDHFLKLVDGYSLIRGKEMLTRHAVGLIEYLSPSVLVCCLGAEHTEAVGGKPRIVVSRRRGEEKIGMFSGVGFGLVRKVLLLREPFFNEKHACIQLEASSAARLAALEYGLCARDELVDRGGAWRSRPLLPAVQRPLLGSGISQIRIPAGGAGGGRD